MIDRLIVNAQVRVFDLPREVRVALNSTRSHLEGFRTNHFQEALGRLPGPHFLHIDLNLASLSYDL